MAAISEAAYQDEASMAGLVSVYKLSSLYDWELGFHWSLVMVGLCWLHFMSLLTPTELELAP